MSVDGHLVLRDYGHLRSVHLVAVDEVSEEAGVGVREVEGLVQDHVRIVAQVGMERVVLQVGRVQVLAREFIAAVLSDYSFEVLHGEEVGVIPCGGLESYCEGGVQHLIVSLIDE